MFENWLSLTARIDGCVIARSDNAARSLWITISRPALCPGTRLERRDRFDHEFFVQLSELRERHWAKIRAIGKAKIDQRPVVSQPFGIKIPALVVDQLKAIDGPGFIKNDAVRFGRRRTAGKWGHPANPDSRSEDQCGDAGQQQSA